MEKFPLNDDDKALIETARKAAATHYRMRTGEASPAFVAAAVKTISGQIFTAGNIICDVANVGICAEPLALAEANKHPNDPVQTIVAVYNEQVKLGEKVYDPAHIHVVSPCGRCREVITDFAPDAYVLLREPDTQSYFKVRAQDLLPYKFGTFKHPTYTVD